MTILALAVGRPGSSKSLSVEILKTVLSPSNFQLRKTLGDPPALKELYFQCSPLTTSSQLKAIFSSAQTQSKDDSKLTLAMVVLDELGLADLSPEKPIKVLHSELERQAVLTSGESQQPLYSVVALSNWVVDAAQVNRGILLQRLKAGDDDLLQSAKELTKSLIKSRKYVEDEKVDGIVGKLSPALRCISQTYQRLNGMKELGSDHYFSMRDFFYCVKNLVCSVFNAASGEYLGVSDDRVIRSAVRNFGGNYKAQEKVLEIICCELKVPEVSNVSISPLSLIMENIEDSSSELSVHIARHLMILNRSLIGLSVLNLLVRRQMAKGTGWHVIFGSCFPEDLKIPAVTRKLRLVEQAIRTGGVLILCYADQLFESLYLVLNQQYWTTGDATFTQIALGPSTRSIVIAKGVFRIIALQDTDRVLNSRLTSPAVLSRFEKRQLQLSDLLDGQGRQLLSEIESHPVWQLRSDLMARRKLLYGHHEETMASLAFCMQSARHNSEVGDVWMRVVQPMEMIKLERANENRGKLASDCQQYRKRFVLDSLQEALETYRSKRLLIMTHTVRHLEVRLSSANAFQVIRLFDIKAESELLGLVDAVADADRQNANYCLLVQFDATIEPMKQFHQAKYELEERMRDAACRLVFIIHVDPNPSIPTKWEFSFDNGWDSCFVDEILPSSQLIHSGLSLKILVGDERPLSSLIDDMPVHVFKTLLFEMIGPQIQEYLTDLGSALGPFFCQVRDALRLSDNELAVQLLKECLSAQLRHNKYQWNVVEAMDDRELNSTASLTEALLAVFRRKISSPLAHLLVVSDISKVSNPSSMKLWCDFIESSHANRPLATGSEKKVEIPTGFHVCSQPMARLLFYLKSDSSYDLNGNSDNGSEEEEEENRNEESPSDPTTWLLKIVRDEKDDTQNNYFRDWLLMRVPAYIHQSARHLPFDRMIRMASNLFHDPGKTCLLWDQCAKKTVAALDLFDIASSTVDLNVNKPEWEKATIQNWNEFAKSVTRMALKTLSSPQCLSNNSKFMQAITSIENNQSLSLLLSDFPNDWLRLRVIKRLLLLNPGCSLPKSQDIRGNDLIGILEKVVINSVIKPRLMGDDRQGDSNYSDLESLLKHTATCASANDLQKIMRQCPRTKRLVLAQTDSCPCCADSSTGRDLVEPDQQTVATLFDSYQNFLFYFERIAELFVQCPTDSKQITDFLIKLIEKANLTVSWQFMTAVVRNVLSRPQDGVAIIDAVLIRIPCNRSVPSMPNADHFLRALVVCADQDMENDESHDAAIDVKFAILEGNWTVDRIKKLARIRKLLSENDSGVVESALLEWHRQYDNQQEEFIIEPFLFFVLRYISGEGDQWKLKLLFQQQSERFNGHFIRNYIRDLSPLQLPSPIQPEEKSAHTMHQSMGDDGKIDTEIYRHYDLLKDAEPEWAPFIARLSSHLVDVATVCNISVFCQIASNPESAFDYYLPGIDNHPSTKMFLDKPNQWYICSCGEVCSVGNCGHAVTRSICPKCKKSLGVGEHFFDPVNGVRRATVEDFRRPNRFYLSECDTSPSYAVRNLSPLVTRCSSLLVSLSLMAGILRYPTDEIHQLIQTMCPTITNERRAMMKRFTDWIMTNLKVFSELYVKGDAPTTTDQFKLFHAFLNKVFESENVSWFKLLLRRLTSDVASFRSDPAARDRLENILTALLQQNTDLSSELNVTVQSASTVQFTSKRIDSEKVWAYGRRVLLGRRCVQRDLARNDVLRSQYPLVHFLLDDTWAGKLDGLQFLADGMRFVALTRTLLQGNIRQDEALASSIEDGLKRMAKMVSKKSVLLDRGRVINSEEQIRALFGGLQKLWIHFSQSRSGERTFLDHFECVEVDPKNAPPTCLDVSHSLIFILAGRGSPAETGFVCQLLSQAVETAASVSQEKSIQLHCRQSGRVRLSCANATAMANFDESLYPRVPTEEVDAFFRKHVIDHSTLGLANVYAVTKIIGPPNNPVTQDLALEEIPEFIFSDAADPYDFRSNLNKWAKTWQAVDIAPHIQEEIITDLEEDHKLNEAKLVVRSVIQFVQQRTDSLQIGTERQRFVGDVLDQLKQNGIIDDNQLSDTTRNILGELKIYNLSSLLVGINGRMAGNIFGTPLSVAMEQQTLNELRTSGDEDLIEILNQLVSQSETLVGTLQDSLLSKIRLIKGDDSWNGISSELRMEHLGHVLRLAESVNFN